MGLRNQVLLLIVLCFCSIRFLRAEYRVYQYIIESRNQVLKNKEQSFVVTSTLDPKSYVAYHGGVDVVQVHLLRTWMCPGDTSSKQKICQSPYKRLVSQGEIESEDQK